MLYQLMRFYLLSSSRYDEGAIKWDLSQTVLLSLMHLAEPLSLLHAEHPLLQSFWVQI